MDMCRRFELMDMFLCCKFAEGDSRILQMKLVRDRLKVALHETSIVSCFESHRCSSIDRN